MLSSFLGQKIKRGLLGWALELICNVVEEKCLQPDCTHTYTQNHSERRGWGGGSLRGREGKESKRRWKYARRETHSGRFTYWLQPVPAEFLYVYWAYNSAFPFTINIIREAIQAYSRAFGNLFYQQLPLSLFLTLKRGFWIFQKACLCIPVIHLDWFNNTLS